MRAAVVRRTGDEKVDLVENAELIDVGPNMVRVAVRSTGVCHSDLAAMSGALPVPTPCVLGHEGAGEVVEVGSGVRDLSVGDHVIATGLPPCGHCSFCLTGQAHLCIAASFGSPYFRVDGEPVFALGGIGSFCEEMLLTADAAVKVPADIPWEIACLANCMMTGMGAVVNAAKLKPGSSVVVFGCGGVGSAIIQAARMSGAAEIVAVDIVPEKLELAIRFGATHAVTPEEAIGLKADLVGDTGGFDYGFEAVGSPTTIRAAYDAVRRGGTVVVAGVGHPDEIVPFNAYELSYSDKTLRGTWAGSGPTRLEYGRVMRLWKAGRLDLEGMITARVRLEEINLVFDRMRAGETGIRTVVLS
jgi:S-(hydroxymethyl)glutathione dehydrogenase / alcohol dehydrogenase